MKKELGIFILFVVLCVIISIANPRFLLPYNLGNTAEQIGMYGIFSIGLGIVIITGGVDLSVGSVLGLLAVILSTLITDHKWKWPFAVMVVMAVSVILGCLHGFFIARVRMQAFIVTLCGLLIYRGLARFIAHEQSKGLPADMTGILHTIAKARPWGVPSAFIILIIVALIMWVVLHRSVYGRYLYAVGRNEDAARYSGINSKLVIASAYALSGLLTGIAGIIIAFFADSISPSQHANSYELYGIAGAVLGGCSLRGGEGSIFGIVVGTAIIQLIPNICNLLDVPSEHVQTVLGGTIFIGVLVDQLMAGRRKRRIVMPSATPGPAAPTPPGQ